MKGFDQAIPEKTPVKGCRSLRDESVRLKYLGLLFPCNSRNEGRPGEAASSRGNWGILPVQAWPENRGRDGYWCGAWNAGVLG
jgi:hypothetical protein